ncbi:HAD superfamily hydrolase (TIGR01450 family) [Aeromicrobium panaciterrae]|uniref:HAD superfamily hydrolase (TIGR01450 family) n=1 Tax=Aeromicrobium panaciterrae TaxID=363861 RepID=A0ABU1UNP0_9ACTN|nr:HAD-IIA family hydrolase [Aeromicrobium panaciterrae]MDR7086801.1 HAD superfamily hydrolase (TIGR01450 family) [Aeromicrobium panaciterrae]
MTLGSSDRPLSRAYDLAMLDLDGVVYVGPDAVPGAVESLGAARASGTQLAYITNNASRTAAEVASHLRELGLSDAEDGDVVTSAQAVAHLVADALPAGSPVLLVGGEGLRQPLEERGLRCVATLDDGPLAVVQGFHPDVSWVQLAEASYAIEAGIPWFASNTDLTIPTARGVAPGNGSLVQAISNATGTKPTVAGKPEAALFRETLERFGGERPLMVGDRLDTDIDGAIGADIDTLFVLTGVNGLQDVIDAGVGHRPTYISYDLGGLNEAHAPIQIEGSTARCDGASAQVSDGVLTIEAADRSTSGFRAAVGLAWHLADHSGQHVRLDGTMKP